VKEWSVPPEVVLVSWLIVALLGFWLGVAL
jgi:hypothetical protein